MRCGRDLLTSTIGSGGKAMMTSSFLVFVSLVFSSVESFSASLSLVVVLAGGPDTEYAGNGRPFISATISGVVMVAWISMASAILRRSGVPWTNRAPSIVLGSAAKFAP